MLKKVVRKLIWVAEKSFFLSCITVLAAPVLFVVISAVTLLITSAPFWCILIYLIVALIVAIWAACVDRSSLLTIIFISILWPVVAVFLIVTGSLVAIEYGWTRLKDWAEDGDDE